jgi:hypothetical protein
MGSSSTTVQENKVPAYLEEASKLAVEEAKKIKEMGYLPYFGPEVAAVNPYEQAMAQNVGGMASAFGLSAPAAMDMSGVDTAASGGVTGYTTAPAYFSALERLKETRPDQYEYFARMTGFDPITGASTGPLPDAGASGVPTAPASVGSKNDGPSHLDIMARHNAMRDGLSSRLDTKGQIGKYATPSHGLSFGDQLKADLGYAAGTAKKDVGKLFGGLFGG